MNECFGSGFGFEELSPGKYSSATGKCSPREKTEDGVEDKVPVWYEARNRGN